MFFNYSMKFKEIYVTVIILAGGKSRRMGSNKAFLKYGNKTFIEHQIAKLKTIFSEIIISSNDHNIYEGLNLPVVSDVIPEKGPLSGICAGLLYTKNSHVFVIACDMPFVCENAIMYLKEYTGKYDVVVPQTEYGLEPMHAFYSKKCIQPMYRHIKEGKLRIIDFFSEVNVKVVDKKEFKNLGAIEHPLLNLNTPDEYKKYIT